MGYWLVGAEYETIPFVDPQSTEAFTTSGGSLTNVADVSLSNYSDRDDIIFNVPVAEWTTKFKLVDDAHATAVSATINWNGTTYSLATAPEFNDGVFTPPDANTAGFSADINNNFALPAYLLPDTTYKVTASYDYSAAAVDFTPSRSMDVFMFPTLKLMSNSVTIGRLILGVANEREEYFGYAYVVQEREVVFNPSHPHYGIGVVSSESWNVSGSSADYTDAYNQVRYFQDAYPNFRAIQNTQVGASFTWSALDAADFANSTDWPTPPTLPTVGLNTSYFLNSDAQLGSTLPGQLVCVIRQSGSLYYVWAT